MSRKGKFAIALAVTVVAAAATTTTVWAVSRGGADERGLAPAPPGVAATRASVDLEKCKSSKTEVITNEGSSPSTSSADFVAVTGLTKTIKTSKGCLIATLSANAYAPGAGEAMNATVVVDGAAGSPILTQFAAEDGTLASAHSAQFVFFLAAGTHTVTAQFASSDGATTVYMNTPSLVITHG